MSVVKACVVVIAACVARVVSACREPNSPRAQPHMAAATESADADAPVASAASSGKFCNIEALDGVLFAGEPLTVKGTPTVRGWLGSGEELAISEPSLVIVDESGAEIARHGLAPGIKRDDVVAAFPGVPGLGNSGFELVLPELPQVPVTYRIHLEYSVSGRKRTCDNGRRISVIP